MSTKSFPDPQSPAFARQIVRLERELRSSKLTLEGANRLLHFYKIAEQFYVPRNERKRAEFRGKFVFAINSERVRALLMLRKPGNRRSSNKGRKRGTKISDEEEKVRSESAIAQVNTRLKEQVIMLKTDIEKQETGLQKRIDARKPPLSGAQIAETTQMQRCDDIETEGKLKKCRPPALSEIEPDSTESILKSAFEKLGHQIMAAADESDRVTLELSRQFSGQIADVQFRVNEKYRDVISKAETLTGSKKELILGRFRKNREEEMGREMGVIKAGQNEELGLCAGKFREKCSEIVAPEKAKELASRIILVTGGTLSTASLQTEAVTCLARPRSTAGNNNDNLRHFIFPTEPKGDPAQNVQICGTTIIEEAGSQ